MDIVMNIINKIYLSIAVLIPGLALAHAHLEMSVPAANSTVQVMPAEIMLHFSEATKITALSIAKENGKDKQNLKIPTETKAVQKVAAPKLGPGVYVLDWRGLSDDTHIVKGSVRFTVGAR
jgi:methionine-rich copper-binding protein CopC